MKDYKRLTTRNEKGEWTIELNEELKQAQRDMSSDDFISLLFDLIAQRLADLEDKIQNGALVELPCKVGEIMYEVIEGMPIQEWKIESISFNGVDPEGVIWAQRKRDYAHWKFWIEDLGTKLFATKAEAEAKLKELKGERKCR